MFGAIPLHQLWGLKDPSQPPGGAEVPAPGDRGVTAVTGLREAQAAWLLHDVAFYTSALAMQLC